MLPEKIDREKTTANRLPYAAPELIALGQVTELTKGSGSTAGPDGSSRMVMVMP